MQIPQQAYEINFVLSDGEFAYENNGGQDFMFPVVRGRNHAGAGRRATDYAVVQQWHSEQGIQHSEDSSTHQLEVGVAGWSGRLCMEMQPHAGCMPAG
jgi:hypothetical protein